MNSIRICSWDVGIKNLAYCVILKEGNKYTIEDWDIIDLIDSKDKLKCNGCMKKSLCTRNAHLFTDIDGVIHSYCNSHSDQFDNLFKVDEDKLITKMSDKEICFRCGKGAYYITDDDNYVCATHKKSYINSIKKKYTLKKIPKKKCSSHSTFQLGEKLFTKLDEKKLLNVDEVLIENQPTLKNPTMKTISTFLFSYFMLRGIIDKDKTGSTITNVRFISPSNKLKVNADRTIEVLKRTEENKKYKLTKQLSVTYTKILLKDENRWLDHLDKYPKKDDLCDALLQGYHYLSKQTNITESTS